MKIRHCLLRHGELDEIGSLIDDNNLDEIQIRAVLLNLIERIRRLEVVIDHETEVAR